MTPEEKLAAEKAAQEAADKETKTNVSATTTKDVVAKVPKGKGKFADTVLVKATAKHPYIPQGKEFKVHRAQVQYLTDKKFIVAPE